ncbi:Cell division protein [Cronobacter sakazakii 701]|nr:Cell division protein [Cronobacter sakazakii 701]
MLERLITRLVALTQQQSAEVWAGMKHDLGLKSDAPLLSRHFPAAEQNLNQRLGQAQQTHTQRQVLSQLTELLNVGNNRQAVSDYIRQQFGHTALNQLSGEQLKSVLTLLQNAQLNIPQPQQRPATDRPMQPAEHNTLNQQVTKLAAATGESPKLIWQSMLELSGVKSGELIPRGTFRRALDLACRAPDARRPARADAAQHSGRAAPAAGIARMAGDKRLRAAALSGHAANGADHRAGAGYS